MSWMSDEMEDRYINMEAEEAYNMGEKIWITKNGRAIHVTEMDDSHLRNALAYCLTADNSYLSEWFDILTEEQNRRL